MSAEAHRYAVFGHPIAHSLSPEIHQAFAAQLGIHLRYETIDVPPGEFEEAVRRFFAEGGLGANVTLPHKEAAFAMADERSEAAQRAGAANTLTALVGGKVQAHNTDGSGFVRDITERHSLDLRGHDALLLGAGGAAKAVAWALLDAGVQTLTIVNRTPERADALADAIGEPARCHTRYWDGLEGECFDLVVNATSIGIHGGTFDLPMSLLQDHSTCYDLSYGAAAASFKGWATAAGTRYFRDGLGMLVEQAADAFEHWHGQRPDTDPVYQTLRQRLG
ncbi:shikimate dehydrogenase [Luteibacter flocculans]|uniref:Shikimate dehydrogenase (NADP(+)) n=1 Tax=Luteibacter flocculans TaxID=2780091 RepID=A0ABY4T754_9GAMM|nr:shikimate dehydrogenase [Luteibacter flocculans]URL58591.1 shikimate dehydrogenase [Luteibacter flocculans]